MRSIYTTVAAGMAGAEALCRCVSEAKSERMLGADLLSGDAKLNWKPTAGQNS